MHTALSGVGGRTVRCRGFIDQALLHDGAVHGEPEWRRGVGCGGSGSGNEGLEDGVLTA